jgi:hypothetical protein
MVGPNIKHSIRQICSRESGRILNIPLTQVMYKGKPVIVEGGD